MNVHLGERVEAGGMVGTVVEIRSDAHVLVSYYQSGVQQWYSPDKIVKHPLGKKPQ